MILYNKSYYNIFLQIIRKHKLQKRLIYRKILFIFIKIISNY